MTLIIIYPQSTSGPQRQAPQLRQTPDEEEAIDTPPGSEGEDAPGKSSIRDQPSGHPGLTEEFKELVPQRFVRPVRPQVVPQDPEVFTAETPGSKELQEYTLPAIKPYGIGQKFHPQEGASQHFSLPRLLSALQHNLRSSDVLEYFSYFSGDAVRDSINQTVDKVPSIFYAVATNNEDIIQIWIDHGGDANAIDGRFQVPLLAFAILNSLTIKADTTAVVVTLLAHGANHSVIPSAYYASCLQDMSINALATAELSDTANEERGWCNDFFRQRLAKAMNISQRYVLSRSQIYRQPSIRRMQAAARYNVTGLFGLPFFITGQDIAIKVLTERLLSYHVISSTKPLVLMFAGVYPLTLQVLVIWLIKLFEGPSGHGKTEIGKHLGGLLSLEIQTIDMTEIKYETDLFGSKAPYVGCEGGSPLNNFLAGKSGKRAIVMLDEFEKSTREVLNSLLILFDEGMKWSTDPRWLSHDG
jgi:hypothetical protein